ncbi:MAG: PilZ domain-containing protein [Polyangiaceae bacterium]
MRIPSAVRRLYLSFLRRRQHPRAPASVVVDFRLFGSGVHHRSTTEDLSPGGALVTALAPLPLGSPVVVTLPTAQGRTEIHARVAWSGPTRMGLRFTRPLALDFC